MFVESFDSFRDPNGGPTGCTQIETAWVSFERINSR